MRFHLSNRARVLIALFGVVLALMYVPGLSEVTGVMLSNLWAAIWGGLVERFGKETAALFVGIGAVCFLIGSGVIGTRQRY